MRAQLLLSDLPSDFRAFAAGWLGFDPWLAEAKRPWVGPDHRRPDVWTEHVPIHIPAAQTLVVAYRSSVQEKRRKAAVTL